MTYVLCDANGYVGDLASGGGLDDLEEMLYWQSPIFKQFFDDGYSTKISEMQALLKAIADPELDNLINLLEQCDSVAIISDGLAADESFQHFGTKGSGNWGHWGRKGQVGGSAPGAGEDLKRSPPDRTSGSHGVGDFSLDESPTVQKVMKGELDVMANDTVHGDEVLYQLEKERGFTDLPAIVSQEQYDEMLKESPIKANIYRGCGRDPKHADDLINGDLFCGQGCFGDGLYFAASTGNTDAPAIDVAKVYTNRENENPPLVKAVIKPDAKIGTYTELSKSADEIYKHIGDEATKAYNDHNLSKEQSDTRIRGLSRQQMLIQDIGKLGVALGYDGYTVAGDLQTQYVVILNRGCLAVTSEKPQTFNTNPLTHIGTSSSGNYGHEGRPGVRGGSAARGEGSSPIETPKLTKPLTMAPDGGTNRQGILPTPGHHGPLSLDEAAKIQSHYGVRDFATGKHGDEVLYQLCERQGFNQPPQVVSHEELQRALENSPLKAGIYRGIGGNHEYTEQFKTGANFLGAGAYGNGIYMAYNDPNSPPNPDVDALHVARIYAAEYTDDNKTIDHPENVVSAALKPDARICSTRDMYKIQTIEQGKLDDDKNAGKPMDYAKRDLVSDMGRLAVTMGYDAMTVEAQQYDGAKYIVVFNRGALVVEK